MERLLTAEKSPLVSVVIPTYNRAPLLERAVKSVFNQTYSHLEIIIVDDGSSDDTRKVVDRLKIQDERVRYLCHDMNKGPQAARNTGIHAAHGEFVAFLDSDDEWLPAKLEKQMAVFASVGSKLGVVYAGIRQSYHDGRPSTYHVPRHRGYIYRDALREWIADTNSLLVRKELLYKVGLWDERVRCDEWDLYIRLARVTQFDFVAEPLSIYYLHGGPSVSRNIGDRGIGVLDVIVCHLSEIVRELGRPGLAAHISSVGKYFIQAKNFKKAKACFKTAFHIWPFNPRPLANWLICSLGPLAYSKTISTVKILQRLLPE